MKDNPIQKDNAVNRKRTPEEAASTGMNLYQRQKRPSRVIPSLSNNDVEISKEFEDGNSR